MAAILILFNHYFEHKEVKSNLILNNVNICNILQEIKINFSFACVTSVFAVHILTSKTNRSVTFFLSNQFTRKKVSINIVSSITDWQIFHLQICTIFPRIQGTLVLLQNMCFLVSLVNTCNKYY